MTLNFAGGWSDRSDAKIQRWPPFLHQRAWSGCRCNQTSGSDLGRRWSLWNDCPGMIILDLLLPDFFTLPHSQSRQLIHYTNYGRDISRGIKSRPKLGRVEIEIGEASPTFWQIGIGKGNPTFWNFEAIRGESRLALIYPDCLDLSRIPWIYPDFCLKNSSKLDQKVGIKILTYPDFFIPTLGWQISTRPDF